jgi:capsular exopolysaccharide synthesis family protein
MLVAMWRYRWAVILPAIAGAVCGFLVYLQTPETYRSTTRLMIESDRTAMFDSMTGDVWGGVPAIEIVESQLFSDQVAAEAFNNPKMQPFHEKFGHDPKMFAGASQESLVLESEITDVRSAQSLVALMHFQGHDPDLCEAAVKSYSESLANYFRGRQTSSRDEQLEKLIEAATNKLHPQLQELEERYSAFRKDAALAWDSNGKAINPHRERQLFLVQRRSELIEKKRQAESELAYVRAISKDAGSDPMLALNIIGQLLNKTFVLPSSREIQEDLRQGDNQLQQIALEQKLVPLIIERNKHESEFGPNHPTVKALDAELVTMKNELMSLVERETSRIVELMSSANSESGDPATRAKEAVSAVLLAADTQVGLLGEQIDEVDRQIDEEKEKATALAQAEQENEAHLREIERTRELLEQLQEQMARVELVKEDGGTSVVELTAPSSPYKIAPNLLRCVGLGAVLGLALGAGLALLLEKNANTFRDPDEIAEILGVSVLTHVPYFKGKPTKSLKRNEDNPFDRLDPFLAAVHMPTSVAAEAIRSCRTSVFFETSGPGGKIIQVTSPLPGDGKSTIAGNLACSIAQSGKRVLAIDCDLRRPQLTDNFALAGERGLTNVLNGDCEPSEATHATPLPNLYVMPSGPIPANPAEALTLPEMNEMLRMLRGEYDYIIVDTPPLLVVTDPSITASMVDGVVLTLRIRRKSKPNAKESINILSAVGARILGVVINNSDEASMSDGYRGYGYYRYGRYTSRYYGRGPRANEKSEKNVSRGGAPLLISGRNSTTSRKAQAISARKSSDPSVAEDASEIPLSEVTSDRD